MEQEIVVSRVFRDMIWQGLVMDECSGYVKFFLNAIYVAGAERGLYEEKEEEVFEIFTG